MGKMILAAAAVGTMLACTPAAGQPAPQGPMSRDAYLAVQKQRFTGMDANKDGIVTREEMVDRLADRISGDPPQRMVDRLFARLDGDADGKASAAEAEAAATQRFEMIDSNHDDMITDDERRAAMELMRVRFRKDE